MPTKITSDIQLALEEHGWTYEEAKIVADVVHFLGFNKDVVWYNIMAGQYDPQTPKGRRMLMLLYDHSE